MTTDFTPSIDDHITTQHAYLMRHVHSVAPYEGLEQKLRSSAQSGRPLVVKLGFDPTAPDLHMGHVVVLRKLKDFQDMGHSVHVIVGDSTAAVGDPSGRNKLRPPLTSREIENNAQTYLDQLGKILDCTRLTVHRNSAWIAPLTMMDVITICGRVTANHLVQRRDFANRFDKQQPVFMHELLYPILQGYDSVCMHADIEIGGTDQLFNCLMGRTLQESFQKEGQVVIAMPLLVGTDGVHKMGKSLNNYIALNDTPQDIYGKTMSLPDHLLPTYSSFFLEDFVQQNTALYEKELQEEPMSLKKRLAKALVTIAYGRDRAQEAAAFFAAQFQSKEWGDHVFAKVALDSDYKTQPLHKICTSILPHLSRKAATRLIEEGAVRIEDIKITNPFAPLPAADAVRIRIGKQDFFELQFVDIPVAAL